MNICKAETQENLQVTHLLGKEGKVCTDFELIKSANELFPEKTNLFKTFAFNENSCSWS